MKNALTYVLYVTAAPPMSMQKTFPGNIGEGISRDIPVNRTKKTTKIIVPLTFAWPPYLFGLFSPLVLTCKSV